jgi:hypothetical protein
MTRLIKPLSSLQRLAALCGTLLAVACATTAPKPTPPVPPAVSIPVQPPKPISGNTKFDAFLEGARNAALAQGIRADSRHHHRQCQPAGIFPPRLELSRQRGVTAPRQ